MSLTFAQTQASKKKYKPTDIIKFPWDEENEKPTEKFEDVAERMKIFQERIENSKNNETKIAQWQ